MMRSSVLKLRFVLSFGESKPYVDLIALLLSSLAGLSGRYRFITNCQYAATRRLLIRAVKVK